MNRENQKRFTVISNPSLEKQEQYNYKDKDKERLRDLEEQPLTTPIGYSTNPMYEKLMQFKEDQKKKRFTVEDLLKW